MSKDLAAFGAAMDGPWEVIEYRHDGPRLRVTYRSVVNPLITWSHLPFSEVSVPPVGSLGRIGFVSGIRKGASQCVT